MMKLQASEDTAHVPVAPNVSRGNGWGLQFPPVFSQECYCASYWLWSLRWVGAGLCVGVTLAFPDDRGRGAYFHVLINHSYVFFGEMFAYILKPSFDEAVLVLLR